MRSKELFSQYFLDSYKLTGSEELNISFVNPRTLITKERFDLACKIFYIESREKKHNIELAKELYAEHIRCITNNTFEEPDSSTKSGLDNFFKEFDLLIDSVKTNGFNVDKSIIPVGSNASILNGSHRVAVCYYFGINVPVVSIESHAEVYDYNFFKRHGMSEKYLDLISALFVKYCDCAYLGFVWPSVSKHCLLPAADKLIKNTNAVFYKKELKLNFRGIVQLMMQLYGQQSWTGGFEKHFKYVISKAKACYSDNGSVLVYVMCNLDLESITTLKSNCRCLFDMGKHSIHVTDTKEEATMASEIVLNSNSVFLLNNGYIFMNDEFADFCAQLSNYYDVCSFEGVNSSLFFKDLNKKIDDLKSFCNTPLSLYTNWFESVYCFGKIFYFDRDNVSKAKSPYEKIWKEFKNQRFKTNISKTFSYRILRKIKRLLPNKKTTKSVNNVQELFVRLRNKTCNYLVLRNFEGFFDDLLIEGHNDIDILVSSKKDRKIFLSVFHAIPRWGKNDGHAYKFLFCNKWIELDIRIVGDNYYDARWQKNMLLNRRLTDKGFYVMDSSDYKFSLAYHALYQKKYLSADYMSRFKIIFPSASNNDDIKQELRIFMEQNDYYYVIPQDKSVICYFDNYCEGRLK